MIELAAGGRAETRAAVMDGWRPAAHLGALMAAIGLMTLPAAIGLLALLGVIR